MTDTKVLEGEIIVPDANHVTYTAVVVSSHESYAFLGNVKRGYETLNTNGNVFVPIPLPQDALVEFDELNTDPRRLGKFRTENVRVIDSALVKNQSKRAMIIRKMHERHIYHLAAKQVDSTTVKQALKNNPLHDMLFLDERGEPLNEDTEKVANQAINFLASTFASLLNIPEVEFDVTKKIDCEKEEQAIQIFQSEFESNSMGGQSDSLGKEYLKFKGIRNTFMMLHEQGLLKAECVIPIKHLADMLVAAPVWFVSTKSTPDFSTRNLNGYTIPSMFQDFICSQFGKNFAWLYQIYNCFNRPLNDFQGRDIMPPSILQISKLAKTAFDFLVIATPYHDLASRDWKDSSGWTRNVDPFLFGFMRDLPFFFLLGRWSGTGLFPLVPDMIADTLDHLRLNKELLLNIPSETPWIKGTGERISSYNFLGSQKVSAPNSVLIPFVNELLQAFEEGRLFEFLREE